MKEYAKKTKSFPGWGYWGEPGEIQVGFSVARIEDPADFQADKLHYHRRGVVYILILAGAGELEVDGKTVDMIADSLIRVDPGERYRHTGVTTVPFEWITVCTTKDSEDKVIVE